MGAVIPIDTARQRRSKPDVWRLPPEAWSRHEPWFLPFAREILDAIHAHEQTNGSAPTFRIMSAAGFIVQSAMSCQYHRAYQTHGINTPEGIESFEDACEKILLKKITYLASIVRTRPGAVSQSPSFQREEFEPELSILCILRRMHGRK